MAEYIDDPIILDQTGQDIANGIKAIADALGSGQKRIYGFRRNNADSNPLTRIEYLNDAYGFTPITVNMADGTFNWGSWFEFVNSNIRPVMLSYDGQVAYELNHEDTSKKLDGTDSDIANPDFAGNAMVEFANFKYVSRLTIGDYDYVYISNRKINDTYKDYAFIDDNHISKNAFYFGMFHGALDSANRMRSIADMEICRSKNAANEKSYCQANGLGHDMISWSQVNYIWDLLTLLGKTDNLQATFGAGISGLSWNDGNNPFGWNVGQTKAKGCFFGESAGQNCVRTLWIEDLWGRAYQRCQGLINDNGTFKVKLFGPYPTPSDASSAYADYINTGLTTPAEGYVMTANCSEWGFLPKTVGGSATTFFCDYFYKNDGGCRFALLGGYWSDGSSCGRYVALSASASTSDVNIGSRLSRV